MQITPLINIIDVQNITGLSKNISERKYNPFILTAQNIELRKYLGRDMMNELMDQVNTSTLSPENELAMELIKPYLSHLSYSMYLKSSRVKDTHQGAIAITGDGGENAKQIEINSLVDLQIDNADFYITELICLIEEDVSLYPLYPTEENRVDPPERTIFT